MRKVTRKRTLRFDVLVLGDRFELDYTEEGGTKIIAVKTSARKAATVPDGEKPLETRVAFALRHRSNEFAVKPGTPVLAYVTEEVPTEEERAAEHLEQVRRELRGWIESGDRAITAFQADLSKDPVSAMKWSDGLYQSAARRGAALRVLPQIELHGLDAVFADVLRTVVRDARNPERSTSPTSNLMAQALTAAYAEFIQDEQTHRAYVARYEAELAETEVL